MSEINEIIDKLFNAEQWGIEDSISAKREQLHKNLTDQVNGWWSGHTAYQIMTKGGFLIDGKSCSIKKLTALGDVFMNQMGGLKHDKVNDMAIKSSN